MIATKQPHSSRQRQRLRRKRTNAHHGRLYAHGPVWDQLVGFDFATTTFQGRNLLQGQGGSTTAQLGLLRSRRRFARSNGIHSATCAITIDLERHFHVLRPSVCAVRTVNNACIPSHKWWTCDDYLGLGRRVSLDGLRCRFAWRNHFGTLLHFSSIRAIEPFQRASV